ncbi:GAF and ANTAR domain-containing protein [Streptomyces sp. NPDC048332]|uniref:GAF and ANTAR domain-containing protein n=1 Tax=Streptomyces sp. NPDC048332 TaxID=3154619 RepID=UPI00342929FD
MKPVPHEDDEESSYSGESMLPGDVGRFSDALARATAEESEVAVPAALCQACVDLLDITGASISLQGEGDARVLWWSSSEVAGQLAEAQYTLGDAPCQSAVDLVAPVLAADLTQGPDARRWPFFAQQAVALGVRAVFSLPLSAGGLALGTLDLYREEAGELSERDRAFAFPMAEAITTALLNLPGGPATSDPDEDMWLAMAESDHEEVHQATGMIMVHLGVDPQQALARLRAHAFSHDLTVTEAARSVIEGKVRFHD